MDNTNDFQATFPDDNIEALRIRRIFRTSAPPLPSAIDNEYKLTYYGDSSSYIDDPIQRIHINDCLRSYNGDNILLKRRYCHYSTSICPPSFVSDALDAIKDSDDQVYEVDMISQEQENTFLADVPSTKIRSTLSFMPFFVNNLTNQSNCFEYRSCVDFANEDEKLRIMLRCISAKFEYEAEPFFYSIALYDTRVRKKLSENFNFDMNTNAIRRMIPCFQSVDSSSISRSAIFSIANPHADICFIVRIEKVLQQGDIGDCMEPYTKTDQKGKKQLQNRLNENARCFCERLGRYRMPVGWAAIGLIDLIQGSREITHGVTFKSSSLDRRPSTHQFRTESGNLRFRLRDESVCRRGVTADCNVADSCSYDRFKSDRLTNRLSSMAPTLITLKHIYRLDSDRMSDDDIIKYLSECRKSSFVKRLKVIPVTIKFEFSCMKGIPEGCIDPDFYYLKPISDQLRRPTKEILEFSSNGDCKPNIFYRNILYVYPMHLSLIGSSRVNGSIRNIGIKIQFMTGEESKHAAAVIVTKTGTTDLQKEIFLPVIYHQRNPHFYDEVKIRLPAIMSEFDHILFTIYHISCQKKEDIPLETVAGFAWLPIRKSVICQRERAHYYLPITYELPKNYPQLSPFDEYVGIRWIDSSRALLKVHLKLVSTIHSQDEYVESFFECYGGRLVTTSTDDNLLRITLEKLTSANQRSLIQFCYVILDKLFRLLCGEKSNEETSVTCSLVFNAIVRLVDCVSKECTVLEESTHRFDQRGIQPRCSILVSYVHFYSQSIDRNSNTKKVHEEIILQWGLSTGTVKDLSSTNAWFLFEMTIRSLNLYARSENLKVLDDRRFFDDLSVLLNILVDEIVMNVISDLHHQDNERSRQLNWSIGFFIHDIISIVSPSIIFELIQIHLKMLESAKVTHLCLFPIIESLKWEYLKIICSHEHFMILNFQASKDNFQWPVSVILEHLHILFSMNEWKINERCTDCYIKAFDVVCTVLLIGERKSKKSMLIEPPLNAIAQSWSGLVNLVINFVSLSKLRRKEIASIGLPASTNSDECSSSIESNESSSVHLDFRSRRTSMMAINYVRKFERAHSSPQQFLHSNLLICFLWIMKYLSKQKLFQLLNSFGKIEFGKLLNVLKDCFLLFEYKSIFSQVLHRCREKSPMRTRMCSLISSSKKSIYVPNVNASLQESELLGLENERDHPSVQDTSFLIKRDRIRSSECSLVVLKVLSTLVKSINTLDAELIGHIFKTYLLALSLNQSESILLVIMEQIREFVEKFPKDIFDDSLTEQCSELCLRLLQYCTSIFTSIRTNAVTSLYFLMKQNYTIENNFAKIKMQMTMSMSWLVGQNDHQYDEGHLRDCLTHLLCLNEAEENISRSFSAQIKDLVRNLNVIIADTIKMRDHIGEPELIADLMHRVANCYQTSPDLRLTWLQNMAQNHLQRSRYMEAGQCILHAAALVSEYLTTSYQRDYMPIGCVALQKISINVLEESAVSDDVVSVEKDNICSGSYANEQGFVGLLEQAAIFFVHAQAYEVVNEIYKVLIPIFEAHRDYKKLSQIYGKLNDFFGRIFNQGQKRLFGTYFRVAFYGESFNEVDEWEFVYKEPAFTKLVEISQRLEHLYGEKFGSDRVEIIKDSRNVERKSLDIRNKVYIQITYVEPYMDLSDLKHRQTHFEKSYNLRRFVYSTPFTLNGRPHGQLGDQYQRRTILTTKRAFPYIKTRIPIISTAQFVLLPIEVAIEDVKKKSDELRNAINQEPCDLKYLQVLLQGSVSAKVNAGPVEIANQFLRQPIESSNNCEMISGRQNTMSVQDLRETLKLAMSDFLFLCASGLQVNKGLIDLDQVEYHKQLEKDFSELCESIGPLVSSLE